MKRDTNIIFIIVGALLIVSVIIVILLNRGKFDWYETYKIESKEPYGAYVISEMLKSYYPEQEFTVINSSPQKYLAPDSNSGHKNYILISSGIWYDSAYVDMLLEFVERGNTAFISTKNEGPFLLNSLFPDTCIYDDYYYSHSKTDTFVELNFFNEAMKEEKDFKLEYVFKNKPYDYEWMYIDSSFFCGNKSSAGALGYINGGYYNFIKIQHGKGEFYVHTTPLAFSNYALTRKENLEYVSKVFSHVPPGDILWDEYSKFPGNVEFNSGLKESQSPFRFILSQESLRWAWYLSLLFLLLYVIYFGKRRQRIIPLVEPNTNTSLEYINTIGQLYYQAQNHKTICLHKMKLFQLFIRNRYFINVNVQDDETIRNISLKSQIHFDEIKNIFTEFKRINTPAEVSSEELITFHQLIENFYKNCK